MRFDYNFGTEASFHDWEDDGTERARLILESLEEDKEKDEKENGECC